MIIAKELQRMLKEKREKEPELYYACIKEAELTNDQVGQFLCGGQCSYPTFVSIVFLAVIMGCLESDYKYINRLRPAYNKKHWNKVKDAVNAKRRAVKPYRGHFIKSKCIPKRQPSPLV